MGNNFVYVVCILFVMSISSIIKFFIGSSVNFNWLNMSKTLTMTLLLTWLAVFLGRRRSEANRLYHEYLNKEVVANSSSSYKNGSKN